jgi:hypothetical protein
VFAKLRDYEHSLSHKLQNAARIADERHCADYSDSPPPPWSIEEKCEVEEDLQRQ